MHVVHLGMQQRDKKSETFAAAFPGLDKQQNANAI